MLTKKQKDLLVGSALGDGSFEYNGPSCRVSFGHSLAQEEYVRWKAEILEPYSLKVKVKDFLDSRTGKVYHKVSFSTTSNQFFNPYYDMFYKDKRRCVPNNIVELLSSPLALAVWYLDDGALRTDCRAFRLHTNIFPRKDVESLAEALFINYGIKASVNRQRNKTSQQPEDQGFILAIGAKGCNAEKFNDLLSPLVRREIPSMLYKFF